MTEEIKKKRRIMVKAKLLEISAVDKPAQVGARMVLRKREFSADERRDAAKDKAAMPDGSFPIRNKQDLKNAIAAFGRAKDKAAVAKHIKRRAKALDALDLLPEDGVLAELLSKFDGEPVAKLKPHAGESKNDFVERFMGDERMKEEYPDEKQRVAVAMSMFRVKKDIANEPIPAGSEASSTPAGTNQESMTPQEIQALQKRLDRAEKIVGLTVAERELFQKMATEQQDSFLALSTADRLAEVKKAADSNPVVYTDNKGREFRKSDDPRLVELAKDADQARKDQAEAAKLAKNERISKRASDLKNLPGDAAEKVLLVEAIEKMDSEQQGKLMGLLGKLDTELAKAFTKIGTTNTPNTEASTVEAKIETLAKSVREKNPRLTEAQAYDAALKSPEGQELYKQHLAACR